MHSGPSPRGCGAHRPCRPCWAGPVGPDVKQSASEINAEVAGDSRKSGGIPLADGAELPLRTVAVQLAEDHGSLGGRVLAEVVAGQLGARCLVDDADERVADLTERLATAVALVDRHREDDRSDGRGHGLEVDVDHLVVALTLAGQVVALVDDRTFG